MTAILLTALLVSQSGCISLSSLFSRKDASTLDTTLLKRQGYSIPPGGMPSQVVASSSGAPRVILEVRGEGKHLESIPLPVDRPMFIEDLVQEAKLHEHLGKLNISIMRSNGSNNPPIRLECGTDAKGKATHISSNYALLPNDHLIVIADQRSAFEKFIEKRFKP
jgi:hypothetical protein